MTKVNLYEFKAKISEYSRRVKSGEIVIICDRNKPFAELRPLPMNSPKNRRKLGLLKGTCQVPSDFDARNFEIEKLFEGS